MSTRGRPGSCAVTNTPVMSPPGPLRCGSTTCSTNAPATAASNALPPRSSTAWALAVAIQCVEPTMPNVPVRSGRVGWAGGGVKDVMSSLTVGGGGVEGVAQGVPEQVEAEAHGHDGEAGEERGGRRAAEVLLRVGQHDAQAGGRRLDAEPQEREHRLAQD